MITSRILLRDLPGQGFEELINNKDHHVKIVATPKVCDVKFEYHLFWPCLCVLLGLCLLSRVGGTARQRFKEW